MKIEMEMYFLYNPSHNRKNKILTALPPELVGVCLLIFYFCTLLSNIETPTLSFLLKS